MKQISIHSPVNNSTHLETFRHIDKTQMEHVGGTLRNIIIAAANPALTFMTHIKKSTQPHNMESIRERLIHEINRFTETLIDSGCAKKCTLAARYCICTCIDEAILRTEWGTRTIWVQNTLLSYFHNETWGGERFYIILETCAKHPRDNIAVLELLYLLLSLGFEGKYFGKHSHIRDEISNKLLKIIKNTAGKQSRQLATHTEDSTVFNAMKISGKVLKRFMGVTALCFSVVFFTTNIKLYEQGNHLIKRIEQTATERSVSVFSQLVNRSIHGKDFANG